MGLEKYHGRIQSFVLMALIIHAVSSPVSKPFNFYRTTDPQDNFVNMISKLEFKLDDIVAMYNNVTHATETWGCSGICRTPIALWLVQSISPCQSIAKVDCPIGLVCCTFLEQANQDQKNELQERSSSDAVEIISNNSVSRWDDGFDASSFVQDPIPGDSQETNY